MIDRRASERASQGELCVGGERPRRRRTTRLTPTDGPIV